jgi:hypothetical protein
MTIRPNLPGLKIASSLTKHGSCGADKQKAMNYRPVQTFSLKILFIILPCPLEVESSFAQIKNTGQTTGVLVFG